MSLESHLIFGTKCMVHKLYGGAWSINWTVYDFHVNSIHVSKSEKLCNVTIGWVIHEMNLSFFSYETKTIQFLVSKVSLSIKCHNATVLISLHFTKKMIPLWNM